MSPSKVIETFIHNFNINTDLTDVNFRKLRVEPYSSLEQDQQFGEKKCLLYHCEFTVYNINVILKILSFAYESHSEVLKLEIIILNNLLSKEIASCKNFLQRKRNMNLVFEVLIKYTKLFEMRRLICHTVFQKIRSVSVTEDDSSVVVRCCNKDFSVKYLELNWTFSWNIDTYEVSDFIEFYCNHLVLRKDCGDKVKEKLRVLVQPNLDFHPKLKTWKMLMNDLYNNEPNRKELKSVMTQTSDVYEILDSDSDESVVEVNCNIYGGSISDEILVIE